VHSKVVCGHDLRIGNNVISSNYAHAGVLLVQVREVFARRKDKLKERRSYPQQDAVQVGSA
jgi:hypothetical protein